MSAFRGRNCLAAVFAAGLLLSGCETGEELEPGTIGYVGGFFGGVAGDEPNAVLLARDVLTAGGTAADAAVAMSFAMTATAPGNVSLGGGGVCMVHDSTAGITEMLDFTAVSATGKTGPVAVGVPAFTRGMVALHARYGSLDWRLLLAQPERIARIGHRLSRATATDLKRVYSALSRDPEFRKIFTSPEGRSYEESQALRQIDLATLLGRIRVQGGGVIYSGNTARQIVAAVGEVGGNLTLQDLQDYRPQWRNTLTVELGDDAAHFPMPDVGGGALLAQAFAQLAYDDRYAEAGADERPHMILEALKRAYIERGRYLDQDWQDDTSAQGILLSEEKIEGLIASYDPSKATALSRLGPVPSKTEPPAGTGILVVDPSGMAVACEFGLNNLFGIGRIAPGTGSFIAAAPDARNRNSLNLGAFMVSNRANFKFRYAAAGGGGITKDAAVLSIAAETLLGNTPLEEAVRQARLSAGPNLTNSYVENENGANLKASLMKRGHKVEGAGRFGRVNVMYCPSGLPQSDPGRIACAIEEDTRGHGLGIMSK
ncbi:gamma-glutamyltransferase [Aestuariispira insulae]|nr:gamma-glutamyltransferase [Aestuariispira insulae]